MNDRYPALQFVATILKVMGALVGLAGILFFLYALSHIGSKTGFPQVVLFVFCAALTGISVFAFGNLIELLMDIERNTRESAWSARQRAHIDAPEMIP